MVEYTAPWVEAFPTLRCTGKFNPSTGKYEPACPHCLYSSTTNTQGDISLYDLKRIGEQFPEAGVESFFISGGEPLLYFGIDDLIDIYNNLRKETGHPKEIGLGTNGFWASSRQAAIQRIKGLAGKGLNFISVSADIYHAKFKPQTDILQEVADDYVMGRVDFGLKNKLEFRLQIERETTLVIPLGGGSYLKRKSKLTRPDTCDIIYDPVDNTRVQRTSEGDYISGLYIFHDGVFACECRSFPLGGLDERLISLLEKKSNDPLIQFLGRKHNNPRRYLREITEKLPADFVRESGILKKPTRTLGDCDLCTKITTVPRYEEALNIARSIASQRIKNTEDSNYKNRK